MGTNSSRCGHWSERTALVAAFLALNCGTIRAEALVFGPDIFARASGAPVTVARQFVATAGAGRVVLVNGDASGRGRVASAQVWLNGELVVQSGDLSMQVASLERARTLMGDNLLQVRLASAPGSHLSISIFGAEESARVLLSGPPEARALDHIPDLDFTSAESADFTLDELPAGSGLFTSRTRILIEFASSTTVATANAILSGIDASIVGALPDTGLLLVVIPDAGDLQALLAAVESLRADPAVAIAVQDVPLEPLAFPAPSTSVDPVRDDPLCRCAPPASTAWVWNYPPSIAAAGRDPDGNWGMEAIHAPNLWNLVNHAIRKGGKPLVMALDAGFNDLIGSDGQNDHPDFELIHLLTMKRSGKSLITGSWTTGVPAMSHLHGEIIAGIIGAEAHNGLGVEGLNPLLERSNGVGEDLEFIGLCATRFGGWPNACFSDILLDLEVALKWRASAASKPVRVLNFSMGYNCSHHGVDPAVNQQFRNVVESEGQLARKMLKSVLDWRTAHGFEPALIVTAAGNDSSSPHVAGAPVIEAKYGSPLNWASLDGGPIIDPIGRPKPKNILVVEALDPEVKNIAANPEQWIYYRAPYSNIGADLSAPGSMIMSVAGGNLGRGVAPVTLEGFDIADYETSSGTSNAAPLVSGLASFLLGIAPDMKTDKLIEVLKAGASALRAQSRNPATPVAPMIDAFDSAQQLIARIVDAEEQRKMRKSLGDRDNGALDGNDRLTVIENELGAKIIVPFEEVVPGGMATEDKLPGDGRIDMADVRVLRDAYLQILQMGAGPEPLAISLDGPTDHWRKDLNGDGCVNGVPAILPAGLPEFPEPPPPGIDCASAPLELVWPIADLNGDGKVDSTSARRFLAPFETECASSDPESGCYTDLDVLADPLAWDEENPEEVSMLATSDGFSLGLGRWTQTMLLADRNSDSVIDYMHSADLHLISSPFGVGRVAITSPNPGGPEFSTAIDLPPTGNSFHSFPLFADRAATFQLMVYMPEQIRVIFIQGENLHMGEDLHLTVGPGVLDMRSTARGLEPFPQSRQAMSWNGTTAPLATLIGGDCGSLVAALRVIADDMSVDSELADWLGGGAVHVAAYNITCAETPAESGVFTARLMGMVIVGN